MKGKEREDLYFPSHHQEFRSGLSFAGGRKHALERHSSRRPIQPARNGPSQQHCAGRKENGEGSSKCPFSPHPPSPYSPTLIQVRSVHIKRCQIPVFPKQQQCQGSPSQASEAKGCYFSSAARSLFRRSIFFCSFFFSCSCFFFCSVCWTFSRHFLFFFLIFASSAFLFASRSGSCNGKCKGSSDTARDSASPFALPRCPRCFLARDRVGCKSQTLLQCAF